MEYFRNPTGSSYRKRMSNPWNLSYSTRKTLHKCPRRFELDKLRNVDVFSDDDNGGLQDNVDFAFGSAVAAGIQQCMINGDRIASLFSAWMAWDAPLDSGKADKKKDINYVFAAVEQFLAHYKSFLGNWRLAYINNKPGVEISARIDLENGFHYYLHIDCILQHQISGKFLVLEFKTTSFNNIHPAIYQNSDQALGYSVVLDALLSQEARTYEVLYLVYKSSAREFEPMFFTKNRLDRAKWVRNLLMDCEFIKARLQEGYFPQRDDGCFSFFRPCPYFEMCSMKNDSLSKYKNLMDVPVREILPTDLTFKISDIINSQMAAVSAEL